jgi:hypothetical protein
MEAPEICIFSVRPCLIGFYTHSQNESSRHSDDLDLLFWFTRVNDIEQVGERIDVQKKKESKPHFPK